MLVAALQMQPAASVEANLAKIDIAAKSAAAFGVDLLVTPEMGVTGYAIWDSIPRLAEGRDGPIARSLGEMSLAYNVAIVAGFPERDREMVYNTAIIVQPDGTRSFYRKCHLFGPFEKLAFAATGNQSPIVSVSGMRASMLICYDVEFPEMVRSAVLAGAEILMVPTALPKGGPANRVSESMVPTRAFENHIFIVYAGLCGEENGTRYQGGSVIVGPDGEDLARAGTAETFLITKIDRSSLEFGNLDPYLDDRRPNLYHL
jgi:predicted amidohydrolase